ncbi:Glu-tRNA(Gln) amidotransferase subunit GatE [Candidatus Woesearchaeota archaeon]|nr:Glu-tRNA(Gln) amidotransferase subunit GatE [Candidatus Woesearchaeota archaeon]
MGQIDYEKIGFKCGIEIHQQLDSHKLFCKCPSIIIDAQPDFTIKRSLRAAAGETGEVDVAAVYAMAKQKQYTYNGYLANTCLVELDEEPPHPINKEALETVLVISKLLNAQIIDEIQVMRKTVVDGSNTAAFQRTALVARNGYLETSKGKIGIQTICIEEDSAKIVKRTKKEDIYNLSRLGIPLVEIATDASIQNPEHAQEVAKLLGMVLRSTKVKRGLGTIRQDVNLSIKEGVRVEIKGFQELRSIPKVIENEVKRQLAAIKQGKKLKREVRKAEPDLTTSFMRPLPGAARMYPETDLPGIIPETKSLKIPKLLVHKAKELKSAGLNKALADELAKSNKLELFSTLKQQFKSIEPQFIAKTLLTTPKEIKKRYNCDLEIEIGVLEKILEELSKKCITEEAVFEMLVEIAQGKPLNIDKHKSIDDTKLRQEIRRIVQATPGLPLNGVIGNVMKELRGKAPGSKIVEIVKQEMKQ